MTSVFSDRYQDVFTTYECEIEFHHRLQAGIPKNPKVVESWLRSKAGISDEAELLQVMRRTLDDMGVEIPANATYEEIVSASEEIAGAKQTCGFKSNGSGPYIESRQVKALLKESVHILYAKEKWGKTGKGPKSFTAERVFVEPQQILLGRSEPDGVELFIGHITGPQGPRSTLGYFEFVEGATIGFRVLVLEDSITPEQWVRIWIEGERLGLGALRSQGHGTFEVTKWEREPTPRNRSNPS